MATLRSPEGCPWDKQQTHQSLLPYLVEESHEYIDAAQANDKAHMAEELGDVLFVLGNLSNKFDIDCNDALLHSINEFKRRIIYCEEHCNNGTLISNAEMIKLWKEAKRK